MTPFLRWAGGKRWLAPRLAPILASRSAETYFEPFLGSGAVLGTLAPEMAVASDVFKPLMEIWQTLHDDPDLLVGWYAERRDAMMKGDRAVIHGLMNKMQVKAASVLGVADRTQLALARAALADVDHAIAPSVVGVVGLNCSSTAGARRLCSRRRIHSRRSPSSISTRRDAGRSVCLGRPAAHDRSCVKDRSGECISQRSGK